jgi:hypothetical protein
MTADGRNLEGNQPRQSIRTRLIRIWPVTMRVVEPDTADELKLIITSRDGTRHQIVHVAGAVTGAHLPAIAHLAARWMTEATVHQLLRDYRARHRAPRSPQV